MKLLFSLVAVLAFARLAIAIPQTFGATNVVVGGRPFEQFASERAAFAPGAALPGEWTAPAADGARTLSASGVVFGVPVAEVRAVQTSERVTQFRVVYRDSGKDRRTLFTRVTQGIAAFTGHPAKSDGKTTKVFQHDGTQIRATAASEGEVVVEIAPAP